MFNKVATFGMLPARRPDRSAKAPANDNRRNVRTPGRACAPRPVCRWSLSPDTGRPVCRWELDNADEPAPRLRNALRGGRPFHKAVFQLSYQEEAVGPRLCMVPVAPPARMPRMQGVARTSLDDAI